MVRVGMGYELRDAHPIGARILRFFSFFCSLTVGMA